LIGEVWDEETVLRQTLIDNGFKIPENLDFVTRYLLKMGNRDVYGSDFKLVLAPNINKTTTPEDLLVVVRREWGNFYGFLRSVKIGEQVIEGDAQKVWQAFQERMEHAHALHAQIAAIQKSDIDTINFELENLRLKQRRYELNHDWTDEHKAEVAEEKRKLNERYEILYAKLNELNKEIKQDSFTAQIQDGQLRTVQFATVVKAYMPNQMSTFAKLGLYIGNIWEFVSDEPREANTEGGVFPAIFGTVLMVLIMAVLATPLGVVAAVYLREYAKQGVLTRTIRIAVNNLAGVPSIVYGVFGLGFFVYFLGGNIDALFFPEALPSPTYGTPGILWASITLAILTLPVVIVATEEGLSRIPSSIREGSLALGATKFETLWRTIIPMSSPAIMTGLILAVARAAGEVAPLMLVGVVKLAPSMPLDGNAPFLHLDRKFMHLGFHIYDVGFQSPNVEAARPLVYATSLLLVLVIVALNLVAIQIRNRLREKYRALES
jgi:phosphate transport system permease protein